MKTANFRAIFSSFSPALFPLIPRSFLSTNSAPRPPSTPTQHSSKSVTLTTSTPPPPPPKAPSTSASTTSSSSFSASASTASKATAASSSSTSNTLTGTPPTTPVTDPGSGGGGAGKWIALVAASTITGTTYKMHVDPQFRSWVDDWIPGAENALAKITRADYTKNKAVLHWNKPTLPERAETVQDGNHNQQENRKEYEMQDALQHQATTENAQDLANRDVKQDDQLGEPQQQEQQQQAQQALPDSSESYSSSPAQEHLDHISNTADPDIDQATIPVPVPPAHKSSSSNHPTAPDTDSFHDSLHSVLVQANVDNDGRIGELKLQIDALTNELQSRTRWEAVRLQEAVRAQALEEKQQAARELAKAERAAKAAFENQLTNERNEYQRKLKQALEEEAETVKTKALEEAKQQIKTQHEKLKAEYREKVESAKKEMEDKFAAIADKERQERIGLIQQLRVEVSALDKVFDEDTEYYLISKHAHKVASAAFRFSQAVNGNKPLNKETEILLTTAKELSGDLDGAIPALVAESLPDVAKKYGVPTREELIFSFESVAREGRKAALIPPGGGLWGFLVSRLIYSLKIYEKGVYAEGNSDECKIARAEYFLSRGDLSRATAELQSMSKLPVEIAQDWIDMARARLIAEQASKMMVADAMCMEAGVSN